MLTLIHEVHKYLHGGKLSPEMLMVESDVMKLEEYAHKITGLIHDKDDVEAWVISKIAKAEQTVANVKHTLEVAYPKRFAHGGEMIKHDGEIIHMMLHHIGKYATKMLIAIRSGKIHIDEWMKHELAIAGSDIDSVYHYLDTFHKQKKEAGGNMDMEEGYFEDDEYADGGKIGKAKLEKELHKLQRELNSGRLQTYIEGDTSDEENAREKERSTKMARFYEVLELLNNYADGGEVELKEGDKAWIQKWNYEHKYGTVKDINKQEYVVDLGRGVKGKEYEVYATVVDKDGNEHRGIFVKKDFHAQEDEYSFGGDLLNKAKHIAHTGLVGAKHIAHVGYNKAHELVSKHMHKEHHEPKKYEIGDMWSEDFDYDGLLEEARKISARTSLSDAEKIFRSLEDVNYHSIARPLDLYIKARKNNDSPKKISNSLKYFKKQLSKFNEEYRRGGKLIEGGKWVVYNPETNEIIKKFDSHIGAKKEMHKLWETNKYNELGMMSYKRWSQENVFCEGGGVGHYEDGGIITSFRLPASDTTPVGIGGIPNYNTPLDEWALHYEKGGKLYKSVHEYAEELEVKSDDEIARLYSEEFGLNIDEVLEDIEDERDEYIRELVHIYKTVLKSKGEI